jgi:hypothetical protein
VNAATPAQATSNAFIVGCVTRGIAVTSAAVPAECQLGPVRDLWGEVAWAGHNAIVAALGAGAAPARRTCARCGHVLVDEDEHGWYYQAPATDARIGLTFMDRVHECDGKPHDVREEPQTASSDLRGQLAKVTREHALLVRYLGPGATQAALSGREPREIALGDDAAAQRPYAAPTVFVTYDGDTHWLECDHGDGEGDVIAPVEPGDSWDDLAAKVREHQAGHGCGAPGAALAALEKIAREAEWAIDNDDSLSLEHIRDLARNGLRPQQQPQAVPGWGGLLADIDALRSLVSDMLQSLPDTADEQEWRDRAGALHVCDPGGQPYRAYTEDDL